MIVLDIRPSASVEDSFAALCAAEAVVHTHGRSSVAVGLVCDEMPLVHYNLLRLGGRQDTGGPTSLGADRAPEPVSGAAETVGAQVVQPSNTCAGRAKTRDGASYAVEERAKP